MKFLTKVSIGLLGMVSPLLAFAHHGHAGEPLLTSQLAQWLTTRNSFELICLGLVAILLTALFAWWMGGRDDG